MTTMEHLFDMWQSAHDLARATLGHCDLLAHRLALEVERDIALAIESLREEADREADREGDEQEGGE